MAEIELEQIPNSTRDRPRRLWREQRLVAAKIERACAHGHDPREMLDRWRRLLEEIEADNAANAEIRDPLRGFLSSR